MIPADPAPGHSVPGGFLHFKSKNKVPYGLDKGRGLWYFKDKVPYYLKGERFHG